ncbi:MAG: NADP-dependent isocitrate dehydrogenase [Betaproteobacteria bacterium]|nr:NADP-dependent isocitrate dehydrogenase [Betaproteobacteria bacterium]
MSNQKSKIIYTLTDEAPLLATSAFLPVVRTFAAPAGIEVEASDISLAGRILGEFSDLLPEAQRIPNNLAILGKLTLRPEANIIKLPNISASVGQLKSAIKELQSKGYALPEYPDTPQNDQEKDIKARYSKCTGSAVNPVLREGNSDRRAPRAVKEFARKNPHSMAEWSQASRSHVSHMHHGDFYHGEKSMTVERARDVKMEHSLGVNVNNGMVDLYNKIATLPDSKREEIMRDLHACHEHRPELAMVDSAKGITNFHSPNDVIVDASMPAMIRNGGKMWGADGRLKDVKAVMPESTFARIYQEMINFCKWHGAFDPKTMGTVPNVGLMAQQAEEYGSHDKTFEIPEDGVANITDLETGEVLLSQNVEVGDIWRMCQVKDAAIRDWVKLAVSRARNSGMPVVFWLDAYRPHEAQLIRKVKMYLHEHDINGLDIQIMSQVRAMRYTLERVVRGLDTISATGNILRDYLTDLFPIMELGTSAKMLSIVPLMAGGGMYETGAGGSAPKHVQQLVEENHLRWDSLGEFLALAVSFEDLGIKTHNEKAKLLAKTLDAATGSLLANNKNPSPKTGELDNRGSQFYLAMYWAQELAAQTADKELQAKFAPVAKALTENEKKIVEELKAVQGKPVDIGGYFKPSVELLEKVMCPSPTFNAIIQSAKA